MNINQLLGAKGLLGYIDRTIKKPDTNSIPTSLAMDGPTIPTNTPIYSSNPMYDEWIFHDQLTRGHVTLNCTNVTSLGVVTTGTAKEAWDSIQMEWGKSTDMRRSHAQEALNRTTYAEGTDIQDHIKLLQTWKAAVDSLSSSAMNDKTWRGIIIQSITYTCALHAPMLNANLISVSLLDKMGLTRQQRQMGLLSCQVKTLTECTCWMWLLLYQTCCLQWHLYPDQHPLRNGIGDLRTAAWQ